MSGSIIRPGTYGAAVVFETIPCQFLLHGDSLMDSSSYHHTLVLDYSAASSPNAPVVTSNQQVLGVDSIYFDCKKSSQPADDSSITITPIGSELDAGTGSFTIDFWVNRTNDFSAGYPNQGQLISGILNLVCSTGKITVLSPGSHTSVASVVDGAWHHVVWQRSGNTAKLLIDGVLDSSWTDSTSHDFSSLVLGTLNGIPGTFAFRGYLSEFRIIIGSAVFADSYTPRTSQYVY